MSDLISRQDAIDAFKKELTVGESKGNYVSICSAIGYEGAKKILENLPSAQLDRKEGTWIKKMLVTETEMYISYNPEWYCSCCGTKYDSHIAKIVNFCYVCGADMRGDEDE